MESRVIFGGWNTIPPKKQKQKMCASGRRPYTARPHSRPTCSKCDSATEQAIGPIWLNCTVKRQLTWFLTCGTTPHGCNFIRTLGTFFDTETKNNALKWHFSWNRCDEFPFYSEYWSRQKIYDNFYVYAYIRTAYGRKRQLGHLWRGNTPKLANPGDTVRLVRYFSP